MIVYYWNYNYNCDCNNNNIYCNCTYPKESFWINNFYDELVNIRVIFTKRYVHWEQTKKNKNSDNKKKDFWKHFKEVKVV